MKPEISLGLEANGNATFDQSLSKEINFYLVQTKRHGHDERKGKQCVLPRPAMLLFVCFVLKLLSL